MTEIIDRRGLKAEMRELLRGAQVDPRMFAALFLLLTAALGALDSLVSGGTTAGNPLSLFVRILTALLSAVLSVGFVLYCMAVRRGQRAEYLTLFDGFTFAGRIIGLALLQTLFITLWSMLFVIPGIIAAYRYQFAYFNLCENPELGCMDALEMSKQQTMGYKGQLFSLDLSYLGWGLLASLPAGIWTSYVTYSSAFSILYGTGYASLSTGASLGVSLLCSLWSVAVQVFYLPTYQCVQLGYYEVAKRTSGVSPISASDRPDSNGFDL